MQAESWRPLFDQSISAYYEGDWLAGSTACDRLLARADLPAQIEELTRQNQSYYARHLADLAPTTRYYRLEAPVKPGWSRFNPSIAAAEDGFRAIVRSANYWFGYGVPPEFGQTGLTDNYLIDFRPDLSVRQTGLIRDESHPAERHSTPVQGFEDCRLFAFDGRWYALATAQDRSPDRRYRMCLLTLDDDAFRDARGLEPLVGSQHEKNWTPLVANETLYLIYSAAPTVVYRLDIESGKVAEHVRHDAPLGARFWRGGTQAIPFDGGFLTVVHEAVPFDGLWRSYRHRLVLLDAEFRISHYSPQFVFLYRGVEFAAGLARHGERLVVSFGVNDREAFLAETEVDEVRRLLHPVSDRMRGTLVSLPARDDAAE